MKKQYRKNGFTLLELLVSIAVICALAVTAVPLFYSYAERSRSSACLMERDTADKMIIVFLMEDKNPLLTSISQLVRPGYLEAHPECPAGGQYLLMPADERHSYPRIGCSLHFWGTDEEKEPDETVKPPVEPPPLTPYIITTNDGVTVPTAYGRLSGSYTGSAQDIIIPNVLNGFDVRFIYQDVFRGKGLTGVAFEENSPVQQIHARAFRNNSLSEIDFPEGLKRIDLYAFDGNNLQEIVLPPGLELIEQHAFSNNNITRITIGAGVAIGNNAFENNDFRDAYAAGGPGTYLLVDGVWTKLEEGDPPAETPPNLLQNSGFTDFANWDKGGGVDLTDEYIDGARVISSTGGRLRQMVGNIQPGTEYTLEFQAKADGNISGLIQLTWYDAAGKGVSGTGNLIGFNPTGQWASYQLTATAPDGAASVRVEVLRGLTTPQGETATVYVHSPTFFPADGSPPPATRLGSTFAEITTSLKELIIAFNDEKGRYPRAWGDYVYTDIGLDPAEWQKPVNGIYYSTSGSSIKITPAEGFTIEVTGVDGKKYTLTSSLNWSLWYSVPDGKWYYHKIDAENEIDISTMTIKG